MLENLFLWVLDQCLPVSLVILAVLLVRLFLKKAPKIFSYALWAVVLFRLLCPVSFKNPMGLLPAGQPVSEILAFSPVPVGVQGFGGPQTAAAPAAGPSALPGALSLLWAAGALLLLAYSGFSYFRLRRLLSESVRETGNIYLCDGIATPFVLGLIRPRIYLPASLSRREKEYILCHEQHHIRRGDPVWKALGFLALCLYWFHPLVWAAFCLAGKDMEMSCDEAVVQKLGSAVRADYAQSLLKLSTGRRIIGGTPLAFGEGSTGSRIRNLVSFKKPVVWVVAAAAIITLLITAGLAADRPITKEPGNQLPEESQAQPASPAPEQPGPSEEEGSFFVQEGSRLTVNYSFENGRKTSLEIQLPQGVTARVSGGSIPMDAFQPEAGEDTSLDLVKDGRVIGSIDCMGLGLEDPAELAQSVDPAKNQLPMPIFAGIALANHADFEDYTVVNSGESGAAATAKYAWQDISDPDVAAVEVPWSYRDCVLAYDWEKAPVFFDMTFEEGVLTGQELKDLAQGLKITALPQ